MSRLTIFDLRYAEFQILRLGLLKTLNAEKVTLPEAVQSHFTKLQEQVKRMSKLLSGLLEYSRAGRLESSPEPINLRQLIEDTIELAAPPPSFKFKLTGDFPVLRTLKSPLERIFLNLITNAFKHHDQESGAIEIIGERRGESMQFTVSDDGPGVPEHLHERIFEIFQTVKPQNEDESSGIGLSIVKKLVENQGGHLKVESHQTGDSRGLSMIFTWPIELSRDSRILGTWGTET